MRRVNLAITAKIEDTFLYHAVKCVPRWISPDMLTLIALASAIVGGVTYIWAEKNLTLLLIINICLIVHWLADSLDGRLARYRKESKEKYGYYIDHMLDAFSAAFFIGGITTSTLTETTAWVWVLSLMLLTMIHAYLKTKISKIFELSMQQLGPTEARFGLIIINFILLVVGNPHFNIYTIPLTLLDIIGWSIVVGFLIVLVPQIFKTAIQLNREDIKRKNDIGD